MVVNLNPAWIVNLNFVVQHRAVDKVPFRDLLINMLHIVYGRLKQNGFVC